MQNMFYRKCYKEYLELSNKALKIYKDEKVSVTKDGAELFAWDGTFSDYKMEGYERVYLVILNSLSYKNLNKIEDAKVELRRAYDESQAVLDNRPKDRMTSLLIGILWENYGEREEAIPFYRRVIQLDPKNKDSIRRIADSRLANPNLKTYIYELGSMPEMGRGLGTGLEFRYPVAKIKSSSKTIDDYYQNMIPNCSSPGEYEVINTAEWLEIITDRVVNPGTTKHNIKRYARMPLSLTYSIAIFVGGTYLSVIAAEKDLRALFGIPVSYAAATTIYDMSQAGDTRFWSAMPQAMIISQKPLELDQIKCLDHFKNFPWLNFRQLY